MGAPFHGKSGIMKWWKFLRFCLLVIVFSSIVRAEEAGLNVTRMGVAPSETVDQTKGLSEILAKGPADLFFPPGTYLVGSLTIPANTRISFAPGAVWRVNAKEIREKTLLKIGGDRVVLEGLHFDFRNADGEEIRRDELVNVIQASDVAGLEVRHVGFSCALPWEEQGRTTGFVAVNLVRCRDVSVSECTARNMVALVHSTFTSNLSVRDNTVRDGRYITGFKHGSEYLRHTGNWSSHVTDQVCWWGGDANDGKEGVQKGSATQVKRGVPDTEPGYDPNTAGSFDIIVANNYAEHGRTLAWGSKGRDVIVSENIARFMSDMAYDTEGSEKVVFSSNISINARAAGIGCYFWSENVVISNNIIISDPSEHPEFAGDFIRLHSQSGRSPSESGSGEILITGNVFSSRAEDRLRTVGIEASRGVTISNNRFLNGRIESRRREIGRLTIRDNEFRSLLPHPAPIVDLTDVVKDLLLSGNSFSQETDLQAIPSPDGGKPVPAVSLRLSEKGLKRVEENFIEGWTTSLSAGGEGKGKLLLRDNVSSGALVVGKNLVLHSEGNLNSSALQPVVPARGVEATPEGDQK